MLSQRRARASQDLPGENTPDRVGRGRDRVDRHPTAAVPRAAVHENRTEIFNRTLSQIASDSLKSQNHAGPNAYKQVVAQASGPQFESRADVEAYHRLGATCANMTIGGESRCMTEQTPPYVGLLLSSNWAAGKDPEDALAPVNHHAVENLAASMRARVWDAIMAIAASQ